MTNTILHIQVRHSSNTEWLFCNYYKDWNIIQFRCSGLWHHPPYKIPAHATECAHHCLQNKTARHDFGRSGNRTAREREISRGPRRLLNVLKTNVFFFFIFIYPSVLRRNLSCRISVKIIIPCLLYNTNMRRTQQSALKQP